MTNHPTPELLSDEAITDLEVRLDRFLSALTFEEPTRGNRYVESVDGDFYFEENADNEYDAFELLRRCQTVRAQQDLLQLADYAAEEFRRQAERIIADVERERDALRDQLAQSQSDNERLALAMQSVEEREAAVCPEDVGFDEYIRTLGKQLAQLKEALTTLQNCQNKPRCENCANLIRATLEKL